MLLHAFPENSAGWSFLEGSEDGAVVRALAFHQRVPGWIPGPGVMYGLILLLVLVLVPRVFSPGPPAFPPSSKTNISKFQFDLESEGNRFISRRLFSVTLVKQRQFIYLFIYLFIYFFTVLRHFAIHGHIIIHESVLKRTLSHTTQFPISPIVSQFFNTL